MSALPSAPGVPTMADRGETAAQRDAFSGLAARLRDMELFGHLAHEEKPALVAEALMDAARRDGLAAAGG